MLPIETAFFALLVLGLAVEFINHMIRQNRA